MSHGLLNGIMIAWKNYDFIKLSQLLKLQFFSHVHLCVKDTLSEPQIPQSGSFVTFKPDELTIKIEKLKMINRSDFISIEVTKVIY